MKILRITLFIIIALAAASIIAAALLPDNIEIRSTFYQIIFDGYVTFFVIVVLLVLAIIYGFIELHKKEYFTGLTLIIVPGLVLFIPGYLITIVFLLGFNSFNEDCIVYQNGDEKIIIQYYNPGAVGTSHTRIIITDSPLTANLRPFNEIKLPAYKNIDFTDEGQPNCDKIPNEITYRNEKYKLVFCKK